MKFQDTYHNNRIIDLKTITGDSELVRQVPPTGRPASISPWAVAALKQRLQEPKGFGSYGAVQQGLRDTLGVVPWLGLLRRGALKV